MQFKNIIVTMLMATSMAAPLPSNDFTDLEARQASSGSGTSSAIEAQQNTSAAAAAVNAAHAAANLDRTSGIERREALEEEDQEDLEFQEQMDALLAALKELDAADESPENDLERRASLGDAAASSGMVNSHTSGSSVHARDEAEHSPARVIDTVLAYLRGHSGGIKAPADGKLVARGKPADSAPKPSKNSKASPSSSTKVTSNKLMARDPASIAKGATGEPGKIAGAVSKAPPRNSMLMARAPEPKTAPASGAGKAGKTGGSASSSSSSTSSGGGSTGDNAKLMARATAHEAPAAGGAAGMSGGSASGSTGSTDTTDTTGSAGSEGSAGSAGNSNKLMARVTPNQSGSGAGLSGSAPKPKNGKPIAQRSLAETASAAAAAADQAASQAEAQAVHQAHTEALTDSLI